MTKVFSLTDIADSLGVPKRKVERMAVAENWRYSEVSVKGGMRRLYASTDLPTYVRKALELKRRQKIAASFSFEVAGSPALTPAAAVVSAAAAAPSSISLSERERAQRDCAQLVLKQIEKLIEKGCTTRSACHVIINSAQAGLLDKKAVEALRNSRDPRGRQSADGIPSPRSLERWVHTVRQGRELAPQRAREGYGVRPWHALAIALAQRPQGSTRQWITAQIAAQWDPAWGKQPPSYAAVCWFFRERASQIDVMKFRHTGSALKALRFYNRRKTNHLWPAQEVHADGWCTHFSAPHPVSGEFVTYEVWHYHDVSTRYVTPFAVGMSESFEVIAKGLENYIRVLGVPAILQTDSTGSVKNDRFQFDPVASISQRAGISIVHPKEVGNSQANGIPENFNTWMDMQAREIATYCGKGMDALTLKRVKKITQKMARETGEKRAALRNEAQRMGRGIVFDSMKEATDWLEAVREKWNAHPHRSLPKITDPVTGARRHQSPNEALQAARDEGWVPVAMDEESVVDLFRPHLRKTVRRGSVSPFSGQRYGSPELEHFNGKEVMVAIDIMDPSEVWVKTLRGEFIGKFPLVEAIARSQSFYEYALEKRAKAQIRRKENQIGEIERRMAPVEIEGEAKVVDIATAFFGNTGGAELIDAPAPVAKTAREKDKAEKPQRYNDMSDIAMFLFGDQIAGAEDAGEEAAAG